MLEFFFMLEQCLRGRIKTVEKVPFLSLKGAKCRNSSSSRCWDKGGQSTKMSRPLLASNRPLSKEVYLVMVTGTVIQEATRCP